MFTQTAALADAERLRAIGAYDLDNPEMRGRLDAVATRTAQALGQPVGLTNLVLDTAKMIAGSTPLPHWISDVGGTPAEWAFCSTTVVNAAPYIVMDAVNDPVQHDNPLVTGEGVGSYAGAPLYSRDGHILGAQCVLGFGPHAFTTADIAVLEAASAEATAILEEYRLPSAG